MFQRGDKNNRKAYDFPNLKLETWCCKRYSFYLFLSVNSYFAFVKSLTPSGLQNRLQMTIMPKIKTISKVSLKHLSMINLGRRGGPALTSRLWKRSISRPTALKGPSTPATRHITHRHTARPQQPSRAHRRTLKHEKNI